MDRVRLTSMFQFPLGDLVTEAANYDPVALPVSSFTAQKLKLHPRTVADLLICINSSRWHLLSWVMDWTSLEQKCRELLENPEIRKQDSELKYLVIDYTQFDDWSSEEDMLEHQNYGIGKVYSICNQNTLLGQKFIA